ncbi:MAG: hypothetical protein HOJ22_01985 [Chloroflexi bacterium]|jgi:hypothetical protein|nr:hypothetical protein [Chloroflexota bacterium]MBT5627034.1 hypothetical protein [Chloroflexota bacterium]
MLRQRNIRSLLLFLVLAAFPLVVVACETEQIQYYLTPTMARPGPNSVPGSTPIAAATELPATEAAASTPNPTIGLRPNESLTPTTLPERVKVVIPPYHFATSEEALAAADQLGCSGWADVTVGGAPYSRACADDAQFERLVNALDIAPTPQPLARLNTPTPAPSAEQVTPTKAPNNSFIPPITPASVVPKDPPPYHYTTADEALAGASELGCSGWSGVTHDGVSYFRACGSNRDYELLTSGAPVTLSGEACTIESDPTARFTHPPTDLENISAINPAGSPIGGVIKPHSYIFNVAGSASRFARVPVYAVADSVLTAVSYYDTPSGAGEYLLFFDVTCEISFKFDHISEVVPKIAAVAPATPSQGSATSRTELIEFKAGEIVAYTVGAGGQGPWDFGAYDLTFTNQFANQERYEIGQMSQSLHTVCPYEYFDEPLSSQMLALLGTHGQQILPGIPCYTTERDVLGAASGAWFASPVMGYEGSVFSAALLAGDFIAVTGIGGDLRVAKGEPTWLDPADLTSSHCYSSNGDWRFIEIIGDGMTMKAAGGQGACPNSLPADATTYYR